MRKHETTSVIGALLMIATRRAGALLCAALLGAALVAPTTFDASADGQARYHYFRMNGGTTASVPPPAPLPASTLSYVLTGPTAVGIGEPYSASSRVSGAAGTVTFSIRSGSLPTGTALDPSTGAVSGTAALPGDYEALLVATDSTGAVGTATLSVSVVTGFAVSGAPVKSATVGGGYSATFSGVGGRAPYVFSTASMLPPGLSLSPSGVLSGVPTATGAYPDLVVSAQDANGKTSAFNAFTITVSDPLRLAWAPVTGTAGLSYHSAPAATGGQAPYAFTAEGQMPPGLRLDPGGALTGVPTMAGFWPLSIRVVDADGRSAAAGPFGIEIGPGALPRSPLAVSGNPGTAETGVSYLARFTATGGAGGYIFSLDAGSLPDGLSLASNGAISGTPTSVGTASGLRIKVADSDGATALSGTFSIVVTTPPALLIAGNLPSSAMVDALYAATFTGYNGSGTGYHFSLVSGALPDGLSLTDANGTDGIVTGYPTRTGTFENIVIQVTDSKGASADAGPFTIVVVAHPPAPLALSGSVPSHIERDTPFSTTFAAIGGAGAPYIFSLASGSLPPGLTLAAEGTLSGTPTTFGAYSFAIRVKDSAGSTKTGSFTAIVPLPLTLAAPTLGFAAIGQPYTAALGASGGIPPYTFTAAGQFPPGIALNTKTGVVSGTATAGSGSAFPLALTVTDSKGHETSKPATLPVFDPLTATFLPPTGTFGSYFTATPSASGGDGGYAFALDSEGVSALAMFGLSFDPATGTVSGTAKRSGTTSPFTMTAADGAGAAVAVQSNIGSTALSITIAPSQDPALPPGIDPGQPAAPTGQPLVVSPVPTIEAIAGRAFAAQFEASGGTPFAGTPSYAFTLASGSLPPWLTLSPSGLLAGTPPAAGAFGPFAVKTTDAVGATASSAPFTLTVTTLPPPNTLLLSGVPTAATRGATYIFDLTALTSGGRPPYSYAMISGSLPEGMTLSPDGIVSASQVTGTSATTTIRVEDADGLTRSAGITFKVTPATVAIAFSGGAAVRAGNPVSGSLTTSLPSPNWTLSQIPTSPDLGLALSGSTFTGVAPHTSSPLGITLAAIAASDAVSVQATGLLTVVPQLSVSGGPQNVVAASIGVRTASPAVAISGLLGAPSTAKVTLLRAGVPFQIASSCSGLIFSTSTGSISGTPSAPCEISDLTIEVVDPADGSRAQTAAFAVSVTAPLAFSGSPDEAVQQSPYLFNLNTLTAGGSTPYAYSIASGVLPEGMVMAADGLISASTVTGSTTIAVVSVTDALGRRQSATLTFEVSDAYAAATLTSSPRVRASAPLTGTLFATLPTPAWTFTQVPASPSLTLSTANGSIFTGIAPSVTANTDFVLTAVAKAGTVSRTSQPMTVTVMPALVLAGGPSGILTPSQGNSFGPTVAPAVTGLQETASFALIKNGTPFDIAMTCPGLAFDTSTGTVTGIPTAVCATGPIAIRITDSYDARTATTQNFEINAVAATATAALSSSSKLRSGDTIAGALSTSINGASWSFSQTPTSPSLELTASGNALSGTAPAVTGLVSYSIIATAARNGVTVNTQPLSVQVAPALTVDGGPPLYVAGTAGNALSTPTATLRGAVNAASFALLRDGAPFTNLSSICPGLTFAAGNGTLSGTPTAACMLTGMSVRGTDVFDNRSAATAEFTIAIGAANASIALAASDVRSGTPIVGNLDTTLAAVTWSYAITPNSPKLTLTTSAGAARGTAPAVTVPTTYTIVATAAAGSVRADTAPVEITVWPALAVSGQTGAATGLVGASFTTATPSAGTTAMGVLSWSLLKNGALYTNLETDCPGLAFDTNSGVIAGVPTNICTVNGLAVMAMDVDYVQAATPSTFAVSIIYGVANAAITSASTLHAGQPFTISGSVNAGTGLSAPIWSLQQISPASPIIAYDKADGARTTVFTGTTPDVATSAVFSLRAIATDAGGSATSNAVNLTVSPKLKIGNMAGMADGGKLVLYTNTTTTTWSTLPAPVNAIGTLTWSILKDDAPYTTLSTDCPGLSFSPANGVITASGSTQQACYVAGLRMAAVDAADAVPDPALSATFAISVASQPTLAATLPTGQQGQPYDVDLAPLVTGGRAPYTFVVASGSLPAGIALTGGHLSTTPGDVITGATSTFVVKVTDADGRSANWSRTLTVAPASFTLALNGGKTKYRSGNAIGGTLATSITEPAWTMNQSPASPSIALTVDQATGVFSGAVPEVASTTSFTLSGKATSGSFSISTTGTQIQVYPTLTLAGGPNGILASYANLPFPEQPALSPNVTMGTISYALLKDGTPYVDLGVNCPGLTFSATTGKITGTPTTACSVNGLVVSAVDSFDGNNATATGFAISVSDDLALGGSLSNAATGGTAAPLSYSSSMQIANGTAPYSVNLETGQLPPGLSLSVSGSTVTLSGMPTNASTQQYDFTIRVTDSSASPVSVTSNPQTITSVLSQVLNYVGNSNLTVPVHNKITIECVGAGGRGGGTIASGSVGQAWDSTVAPYGRVGTQGNGGSSYVLQPSGSVLCEAAGGAFGGTGGLGGGRYTSQYPNYGNSVTVPGNNGSKPNGGGAAGLGLGIGGNGAYFSNFSSSGYAIGGGSGLYARSIFLSGNIGVGTVLSITGGVTTSNTLSPSNKPSGFSYTAGSPGQNGGVRITIQ